MKDVIGLIHPASARHHRSKVLCNNPDVIISRIRPLYNKGMSGWYMGDFKVLKKTDIFKSGYVGAICGFRPRRIEG